MADARQTHDPNAELEWLRRRVAELEADARARVRRLTVRDLAGNLLTPTRAGAADEPDVVGYAATHASGRPASLPAPVLRATAERYALLSHATAAGILDLDLRRRRGYLSPRWKELVGYQGDDAYAGQAAFEERLHPDDQAHYGSARRDHLQRRAPFDVEVRLQDPLGGYRWVHVLAQAQWNADGQPVRLVVSVCDVTARKRAEEALREQQRARGQLEGVTYTAREMAHYLNNELTVVAGALELVQLQGHLSSELRALVESANGQLDDAARHLAQLQQVVRVTTKNTPVGPSLDLDRSVQPEPPVGS
jgi:PAS domain S-box-containing protein